MPNRVQVQGRTPEEIKIAEEKQKQKEEAKAKPQKVVVKQKKYYDVRVEVVVPATITYRIYAEDENAALLQINKQAPTSVRPNVSLKKMIKATVYDSGSSIIRAVKAFRV